MRVLLDESLPRPLGRLLVGHAVRTVGQVGWASLENGVLLRLAATDFDGMITDDDFHKAAERVLRKNADPYRRLA